ncbi:MAG: hypothetical protein IPK32_17200 [Verrucomicrobiaceae bacterium]|nr:hypothetical protein [Verrucomicrobiaceae bacterium]
MPTEFDFQYAMENTRVLHEPDRRIDTFGSTQFQFQLITEPMDSVGVVRVREGKIVAEKPLILRPDMERDFGFEGWSPEAEAFGEFLRQNIDKLAFLKYGFNFRKTDIQEQLVHEGMEEVCGKLKAEARANGNPALAIIHGVDDTWEICLLKFTVEMIEKSAKINIFDFKRRGLIG